MSFSGDAHVPPQQRRDGGVGKSIADSETNEWVVERAVPNAAFNAFAALVPSEGRSAFAIYSILPLERLGLFTLDGADGLDAVFMLDNTSLLVCVATGLRADSPYATMTPATHHDSMLASTYAFSPAPGSSSTAGPSEAVGGPEGDSGSTSTSRLSDRLSGSHLLLYNAATENVIGSVHVTSRVLRVGLTHDHLVAICRESVFVYSLTTLDLIHAFATTLNASEIYALATSDDGNDLLAVPHAGKVLIGDCASGSTLVTVATSSSDSVAAVALSPDGSILASVSAAGSVLRTFQVPSGEPLGVFRRGRRPRRTLSLAFGCGSADRYVTLTSDSGAIHIFDTGHSGANAASTWALLKLETKAIMKVDIPEVDLVIDRQTRIDVRLVRPDVLLCLNLATGEVLQWEVDLQAGEARRVSYSAVVE